MIRSKWTSAEDETVRLHAGDYVSMGKALPHKTYNSLRSRAKKLGLVAKRKHSTAAKIARLRRHYPTATKAELEKLFPGDSFDELQQTAKYFRIRRQPPPVQPFGFPLIDAIRLRSRELGISARELDRMTKAGAYFYKAHWHAGYVHYQALTRAVEILGGQLQVEWDD
jgi:hypothetical protein